MSHASVAEMFLNNSANVWDYADVVQITRCQPPYPQQTFVSVCLLSYKSYKKKCCFEKEEEIGTC